MVHIPVKTDFMKNIHTAVIADVLLQAVIPQ